MSDSPFIIIGGGVAGLAAALGLAHIGKSSLVLEKSADFSALGAGLQLGPNAVNTLKWLGVWNAVAPHCVAPTEIQVRDAVTGEVLQRIKLGAEFESRFGAPYRVVHRNDLHSALLQNVQKYPGITLAQTSDVTDVSTADTSLKINGGKPLKVKAIIAAEGVHSTTRSLIQGRDRKRQGHTIYRTLVPINAIPETIDKQAVTLWLYPGGHVVHYAVSNGELFNIVASSVKKNTAPFTAFPRACRQLADLLQAQSNWTLWPALEVRPNATWYKNRTVLLGDAAHASLPHLAQGAAMALEDACLLASAIHNFHSIDEAFKAYASQRYSRTTRLQKQAHFLSHVYHASGLLRQARNFYLKRSPPENFLDRYSWIYSWKLPVE